jgi:hypothetical protein
MSILSMLSSAVKKVTIPILHNALRQSLSMMLNSVKEQLVRAPSLSSGNKKRRFS